MFRAAEIGVGVFFDRESEPSLTGYIADTETIDHRMPITPETRGVFCGPENDVGRCAALADRLGVPLLYYVDRHGLDPALVPHGSRAAVYAYPTDGRTARQTAETVAGDVARLADAGIGVDLIVALYRRYAAGSYRWSESLVLSVLDAVWPIAATKCGAVWCFAKYRYDGSELVDGIDRWPSFAAALRELRIASPEWRRSFPSIERPTPGPVASPTTDPVETPAMKPFKFITKNPILAGFPDEGYVPAAPTTHQDADKIPGCIGVRRTDTGKWRFVGLDGTVEDTRDSAGAGERFVEGVGNTVVAQPEGWTTPYVFGVQ